MNITFRNTDATQIRVDESQSKVKIKGGFWAVLGYTEPGVLAHGSTAVTYALTFGCNVQRQYKFYIVEAGKGYKTVYYPSTSGFTTLQTFTVKLSI